VLLVCVLFWLIFSIMGVEFFGGKFWHCVDQNGTAFHIDIVNNRSMCEDLASCARWVNLNVNFDNSLNGLLALLQVATFKGWMEVMDASVDARGVDLQPSFEYQFHAYIYFLLFIIVGSFFTLNLFIGVIIENFNRVKEEYEAQGRGVFLAGAQKQYLDTLKKMLRQKPRRMIPRPRNCLGAWCFHVVAHPGLEVFIIAVILLNLVTLTFEHYDMSAGWELAGLVLNIAFTSIFTAEALLKLCAWRRHYFASGWNKFDLAIVLISIAGIVLDLVVASLPISPTFLRVLRLVRVVRVLRLVKRAKGIRTLLLTLLFSGPALINIGSLLVLMMFVFTVIGMGLFGNLRHNGVINDFSNFEDFGHALTIMFRLITAAGWNDVLDACSLQPPDCDPDFDNLPNGDCGEPVGARLFFSSFVMIMFLVIVNMFIAIVLENLTFARASEELRLEDEDFEGFYARWELFDPHATQFIHVDSLHAFVSGLKPPLGMPSARLEDLGDLRIPLFEGDRVHSLDVLHALTWRIMMDEARAMLHSPPRRQSSRLSSASSSTASSPSSRRCRGRSAPQHTRRHWSFARHC
jgi:hypothetical protein